MRLFGFEITRPKAAPPPSLSSPAAGPGGWWPVIRESFTGAWQRGVTVSVDTSLTNPVLFRCVSLIASDIAKMRLRLMALDEDGIWCETESPAFSPVLRKPNRYQNRIQFIASWMQSKLCSGNTYVLKVRDGRGVVVALYVLDPHRVKPLVAPDGGVYYQLARDNLSTLPAEMEAVPASEIIHDRWNTMFHPLIGLSPIFACGLAAVQGREMQSKSEAFFRNGSRPGGILTAPGDISEETARRLKETWEANYTGENAGKVAVLGDGLKFEAMSMSAADAQLIEQLKWTGETICGCFGVPPYMAGVGPAPLNNNVQTLAELYYSQCAQIHVESIELCLDEGLGIGAGAPVNGRTYGTEFDLDDLLRMDTATQLKTLSDGVLGGIYTPDEARRKLGLPSVEGGDAVYLQQQNFSLAALARRDASANPFGTATPSPASLPKPDAPIADPEAAPSEPPGDGAAESDHALAMALALYEIRKGLADAI